MSQKKELCFRVAVLFFVLCLLMPILTACEREEKVKVEGTTPTKETNAIVDPIKTDAGLIAGMVLGEAGKEVRVYRGIPYAAPPVGDLRWKPPQPVTPWSGIRDATQYGNTAIQGLNFPYDSFSKGGPYASFPQDEDCLYLNVITPAKNINEKLPVMVWIHGGGSEYGSGNNPLYNGSRLPQAGVVVVTVNRRLGVFGLLAHPLLSAESQHGVSGNYMILDMLASLEWVKNNIAAFGGDPDNVTIFGQSSGGGMVATLVASPLAKGLFKKAICQSGGAGVGIPLSDLEKTGEYFFNLLGVTTLEEARNIPWQDIQKADAAMNKDLEPGLSGWNFAVDGWVNKDNSAKIFMTGKQNPVQMMLGANLGELGPGLLSYPVVIRIYKDMLSGLSKTGTDCYTYIFDQVPINWRKKGGTSVHAMDIFYVFGDYDYKTTVDWPLIYELERYYGVGPEDKDPVLTEIDKKVSEEMMTVWAQFAKTGNPSVEGLITVPSWEPNSDKYLYIADPLQVKAGFSTIARSGTEQESSRSGEIKINTNKSDQGYELSEVDQPPQVLKSVTPQYPEEAKKQWITGRITLLFIVTKEGTVRDASVIESDPAGVFDQCALDAIEQYLYEPATKDGEAVDVWIHAPMVFELR